MIVGHKQASRIFEMLPPPPPDKLQALSTSDALRREVYAEGFRLFGEVLRTNASWVIRADLCEHSCWAMLRWVWSRRHREGGHLKAETIAERISAEVGLLAGGQIDDVIRSAIDNLGKNLWVLYSDSRPGSQDLKLLYTAGALMYIDIEVLGHETPAEMRPR